MKTLVLLLSFFVSFSLVNAQCATCPQGKQSAQFTPTLLKPAPIGGYTKGVAYIQSQNDVVMSAFRPMITATVYLLKADGTIYPMQVSGEIIHVPSNWNRTFYGTSENPVKYPLAVPITIQVSQMYNEKGQPLQLPDGSPAVKEDVTFF